MKRILFVDDEVSILDGLKRMLRPMRTEWEMSFAPGGEAALEMLASSACDVIVTDMRMPGMDGAALLEIVREKYPSVLRIILSGYTELQASIRAVPVAHQFLLKPCDPEMLRAGTLAPPASAKPWTAACSPASSALSAICRLFRASSPSSAKPS